MQLSPSPRIRRSPYHDATLAEGVTEFSVYNRMLMPTSYGDPAAEYRRLTTGVAMWDVQDGAVALIRPGGATQAKLRGDGTRLAGRAPDGSPIVLYRD